MEAPVAPATMRADKTPSQGGGAWRGLLAWQSLRHFAADIKIAHSVFALPFAMSAFILGHLSLPNLSQSLLLLACMVSARSFAMGMNRYLDRDIDARNPRTMQRRIPRGDLPASAGLLWSLAAGAMFIASAFGLSPLAGYLAPLLLLVLIMYSFMKRISWLTHWYLGMCLGLAPIGVAVALRGTVPVAVLLLGLAVSVWTAGFDILYALQDLHFDRNAGLRSVPGQFGPHVSLWLSRACFAAMVVLLAFAGRSAELGGLYFIGVGAVAVILLVEHWLVRDARHNAESRHLNLAFFNANAYVSVIFFMFAVLGQVLS